MIDLKKEKKLSQLFEYYFEKRMLKILLLGAISGFPWVIIGSSLTLWLNEKGLSRSTIGWAGLIFAVYAFNYLWAPLIDRIYLPFLSKKIGHRKSWIFLMQLIIIICLIFWSFVDPVTNLSLVITIGLIIAISSSTQDITIDALRIEQIRPDEKEAMSAGAAIAVVGWWSGYKLGGAFSLTLAQFFQNFGYENYWELAFIGLCTIIVFFNVGIIFIKEKNFADKKKNQIILDNKILKKFATNNFLSKIIAWISSTISGPLISFFKKNGFSIAIALVAFIFLFKIGEAFLGRMSVLFYKEIGFSKSDIALYSKTFGWITTVIFTLIGGLFTIRSGIVKSMFVAGILMASTNLLFTLLAWSEKSYFLFALAVVLDDIAAAFATVAFVAFISLLVDRNYTATQYALLASIGTAGRTTLASSSGALVDWLNGDWGVFFILTALMVIPSLVLLYRIKGKIKLND